MPMKSPNSITHHKEVLHFNGTKLPVEFPKFINLRLGYVLRDVLGHKHRPSPHFLFFLFLVLREDLGSFYASEAFPDALLTWMPCHCPNWNQLYLRGGIVRKPLIIDISSGLNPFFPGCPFPVIGSPRLWSHLILFSLSVLFWRSRTS